MQPDEQPDDPLLRAALFNVHVPSGLRQRLLDRLRAEAASEPTALESSASTIAGPQDASSSQSAFDPQAAVASNSEVIAGVSENNPQAVDQPVVELARTEDSLAGRPNRRSWAIGLALSIVALVGLGVYQWTRPVSTKQLAQFTLGQLDRLLSDEAVWQTDFDQQLSELAVLEGQLRFNIQAIGFQDQSGDGVADQCRVWKLYSQTTHKVFFVFDFKQAQQVQSLTRQLQELQRSSGGWSLAAMQTEGRLVVVAVEGRVDSYLYHRQSA